MNTLYLFMIKNRGSDDNETQKNKASMYDHVGIVPIFTNQFAR